MKLIALLLALGNPDIAPDPLTTGGTSLAAKDGKVTVEMTWEEVDLWPSTERNVVTAVFGLKNTGKEETEFEVGFPSYYDCPLKDFAVEIDGKKELAEIKRTGGDGPKKIFTYWMCWRMKFAPGQERQVKVDYWVKTGTPAYFDVVTAKGREGFTNLGHFKEDCPEDIVKAVRAYESGYVLRTGAGWAGKIGKAVVRLHYGEGIEKAKVVSKKPAAGWEYDEKTKTEVLTLTDFEPDASSDIEYQWRPCTWEEQVQITMKALREKRLGSWNAHHQLEEILDNNLLKLPAKELEGLRLEFATALVPPAWTGYDQSKINRGHEALLERAFKRALAHDQEAGKEKEALALAKAYEPFLKFQLDRDVKWKGQNNHAGRDYAAMEAEHARVKRFLDGDF